MLTEADLDQDTWPHWPSCPTPVFTHLSAWGGRAVGDTDAGLGAPVGSCTPGPVCGWRPHASHCPLLSGCGFLKTTFLRDFLCYKICRLEVVSSVFAKVQPLPQSNFRVSQQPHEETTHIVGHLQSLHPHSPRQHFSVDSPALGSSFNGIIP